jgi:agmatine/peptidylarginine deiminase
VQYNLYRKQYSMVTFKSKHKFRYIYIKLCDRYQCQVHVQSRLQVKMTLWVGLGTPLTGKEESAHVDAYDHVQFEDSCLCQTSTGPDHSHVDNIQLSIVELERPLGLNTCRYVITYIRSYSA